MRTVQLGSLANNISGILCSRHKSMRFIIGPKLSTEEITQGHAAKL